MNRELLSSFTHQSLVPSSLARSSFTCQRLTTVAACEWCSLKSFSFKCVALGNKFVGLLSYHVVMPRLDFQTRRRVIALKLRHGLSVDNIKKRLEQEDILVSRQSLHKLLRKYRLHGTYVDLPRRAQPKKISLEMYSIIEDELTKNDELTSPQLRRILTNKYPSFEVSLPTIRRARQDLGWVSSRPHYCQLIREVSIIIFHLWCTRR